ncbi:hypothetical protein V6N13_066409 [Hibiscus sabdariffa]|uniref:GRF-type domain-containing protein n=1 Tax=Hibiscus sabdariffa TaxID=183260 RepID=A0ABR2DRL5_9ROSI
MASSSTSSPRGPQSKEYSSAEREYDGEEVLCNCGDKCPMWTAWKNTEYIGRRFFGCPNYKIKTKKCQFILWVDGILSERATSLIYQLKTENDKLRHSSGSIENVSVEKLKFEMEEMKKEMSMMVETYERRNKKLFRWMVIAWIICVSLIIGSYV